MIEVGDIVELKSGSPKMTVVRIEDREGNTLIRTSWYNTKKEKRNK